VIKGKIWKWKVDTKRGIPFIYCYRYFLFYFHNLKLGWYNNYKM